MCVWPSNRQEATALLSIAGTGLQAVQRLRDSGRRGKARLGRLPGGGRPVARVIGRNARQEGATCRLETAFSGQVAGGCSGGSNRGLVKLARRRCRDPRESGKPSFGPLLVYAMDRTQATPLTTFTPIDILRGTLGVGPCQYILQTEGLSSDANPTPDNVMTWIEKQFSRKKEKKAADEIRERLAQMVEHVGQAQARIDKYGRMFAEVERLCDAAAAGADTPRDRMTMRVHDDIGEIAGLQVKPPPAQRAATGRPGDWPDRYGWRGGMRENRRTTPRPRRRAGSQPGRLPHQGSLCETVDRRVRGRSSRRHRVGRKRPIQDRGTAANEVTAP